MQNLSKFALAFQGIPNNPSEEYIGCISTWNKAGRLIRTDWGTYTDIYLAHYDEVSPKYDETTGQMIPDQEVVSTRAFAVTVQNPVTREKIVEAARKKIYNLNGVEEQLKFTQEILSGYVENPGSDLVKTYEEVNSWINWAIDVAEGVTVEQARAKKISEIDAYDTSTAVNCFYLDGMPMWVERELRVSLNNSIPKEIAYQEAQGVQIPMTTLWYGTIQLTLPCELALQLLSAIEIYSIQAFNVTAEHKSNVEKLDDVEKILNYDISTGYPPKLNLSMAQLSRGKIVSPPEETE